jgi:Rrf2 family transcriptional regulator, nitric oxide-sensitive transcriptional repressor
MRLLSDASEYALRAVLWLADRPGQPQTTHEIAAATKAAPGYLAKVLQSLGKAGILRAQRGMHGGFTLQRDPREIAVLQVINAVDPIERILTCPLGIATHGSQLCPLHRRIDDAVARIEAAFADTTIAEILAEPSASKPLCEHHTCAVQEA